MTTVLNLYGGPGAGKSTMAAYLFYLLKTHRLNTELVREYVKDWAWEKRNISTYDQMYIAGKHVRKESLLLGKVDFMVTDYPVLLSIFYSKKFSTSTLAQGVESMVQKYYEQAESEGHRFVHIFLNRDFEYDAEGRYQTEAEAKEMDGEIISLLHDYTRQFRVMTASPDEMLGLVKELAHAHYRWLQTPT